MKFILTLMIVISFSFAEFNEEQIENARLIKEVANSGLKLNKAKKYYKDLTMISFQESLLGEKLVGDLKKGKPIKTASVGMFHMRVVTVRELQRYFPEQLGWLSNMTDEWITSAMLNSKEFSVVLALYNLERIAIKSKGNHFKMISQWNGGFHNDSYYNAVMEHKDKVSKIYKLI